jgi:predicted alpha/beta-fold hydrolase
VRKSFVQNVEAIQSQIIRMQVADAGKKIGLVNSAYAPPWWLPGGNLQTIYPRVLANRYDVQYERQRWETPDGDFMDLDWVGRHSAATKLLVLFHGLEGGSRSHYALSLMTLAQQIGWRGVVPHFRGCSGEINRLTRAYHSGDSGEIDWILRRIKTEYPDCELYAAGVSLGGNMFLKWLGEQGPGATGIVNRAVAVSAPVDLRAAAAVLDFGYRRTLYTRRFLGSLRAKVLAKISAHGLKIDIDAVHQCSTFRQIDDLYTAPIHGFKDADDYWMLASSKPWLKNIEVPTLLINAQNDPFLPAEALPTQQEVSGAVILEYPESGGHVGFVVGTFPGSLDWLPQRIAQFFALSG